MLYNKASAQLLPCATPAESHDSIISREKRLLQLKSQFVKNARISGLKAVQYLPIKAHILRNTDGTGGLSMADLNTALVQINRFYQNVGSGLQFYFCGSPNFINNSTYYDFDNTEEAVLCNANDVSNAINIYFPNSIYFGSFAVAGYAYFPSTVNNSNRVFVQAQYATDNRTLAHELGHYFNLLHTFQNSTNTNNAEREYVTRDGIQGANCNTKGDLICDTPADPYGRDSVSIQGCSYTGSARDPKGQLYAPSLSNIMSYYSVSCGSSFTAGQYARMTDGFLLRTDPANQYTASCGPTVTGANVPGNLTGTPVVSGLLLTFSDNSSNESGFIIERSVISASEGFSVIGALPPNTTTFTDQATMAYTTYYYRVKASNSSTQYSPVFTITTALNYCIPSFSNSCSSIEVVIDDFILSQGATNVINNINTNCSTDSYGDFTGVVYNVTAGATYTFTARARSNADGLGSYFDQHLTIWADLDQDGLFELNERFYRSDSLVSMPRMSPTATGSFVIPNTAGGLVRLRVRSSFNLGPGSAVTDPCGQLTFGETEDYMLQVNSSAPASITTGAVTPGTVCAGQAVSVSFTGANLLSTSYTVQLSDASGSNFVSIPTTGTNSPLMATIPVNSASGTGYKVRVISTSPSIIGSASAAFTINATPAAPTASTPIGYCQSQMAEALTASGSNLKWYTAAVSGTGSPSAPTPSTTAPGTVSYWVSQTVSGCESARTKIDVTVTATPAAPTASTPIGYCQSQMAEALTASGSNLKWYTAAVSGTGSPSAPTPSTTASGTVSYWVSQTVSGCESARTKIDVTVTATPAAPTASTPINYSQGQTPVQLSAVGSNLQWYTTSSGDVGSTTAPIPSTATLGTADYYVSQTVNSCESSRTVVQVIVTAPATAAVCINVALFLEGPYLGSQSMTTKLNQLGLLPGQTPVSPLGVPTPAGQPYTGVPWNYTGSETVASYPLNTVDWVLVSLRTGPQNASTTVFRTAALLLSNGNVSFLSSCPVLPTNQPYYIAVEHRNHMGVVSHQAISVNNNTLSYNFSTRQSYIPAGSPANGQKQLAGGIYVLYAADCTKNPLSQIDANDTSKWRADNGRVGRYLLSDFNLDGAPDANDNTLWRLNNGRFSGVNF
ncbi:GEVED domain-containing protein [Runella slithyformis]|uniref:GEVED domain-containing protein n=1 Tax=Runella slithyformis TaxID=106 RepID=UPI00146B5119|nr:GEVED domain-containing protein [Runella slithyformis]